MKQTSFKNTVCPQLRHAISMLERTGHRVHIKQKKVDAEGRTRYYFTLLKRRDAAHLTPKSNMKYAQNVLSSVYGASVKVGRSHVAADVLADSIVGSLDADQTYHCQRMTVIM